MELSSDEKSQYTVLIDGILKISDLSTISEKRIRKQMQEKLGKDLTAQKAAISELIMERFDSINEQQTSSSDEAPLNGASNGKKRQASNTDTPSESESPRPPKKIKKEKTSAMSDAKLAAQLQAQENSRARPSRTGVVKRPVKVKKKSPKKKSAAKIKGEDDSDMEIGSDGEKKPKVKKGGFHKPYYLSEQLQALVGEPKLPRTQVVKKIWEHVRAFDLQDPTDKRQILCDEKMQNVFKVERLHMFTMNKLLGKHLYPIEDEPEPEIVTFA